MHLGRQALAPPHASKLYGRKKAPKRGKGMLNRIASNYLSGRSDASLVRVHPEMKRGQVRKIEAIDRLPVDEIKGELLREMSITQLTKKEAMKKYHVRLWMRSRLRANRCSTSADGHPPRVNRSQLANWRVCPKSPGKSGTCSVDRRMRALTTTFLCELLRSDFMGVQKGTGSLSRRSALLRGWRKTRPRGDAGYWSCCIRCQLCGHIFRM